MRPGTLLRLRVLRKIIAAELHSKTRVVDLGAYDGAISWAFMQQVPGLDILAVDIDQAGLEKARDQGMNSIQALVQRLPFPDESIDVILCLDLIEHVEDDRGAVREMARVLKPGGTLILTTPRKNGVTFPFMDMQQIAELNRLWGHLRPGYAREELDELLGCHGLTIERTSLYFNYFSRFAYWLAHIAKQGVRWRERIYRLAIRTEPYLRFRAIEHIIVVRKQTPPE